MRAWSIPFVAGALAACSFDPSGVGDGTPPDAFVDPNDDGGGIARTWVDDTVEDFDADGRALDGAVIEPWGAIGPVAYHTGGLLARSSNSELFTSIAGDPWPALEAATPAGYAIWGLGPREATPPGLGLSSGDTWTVWLEGEAWFDAGAYKLSLRADDRAFVDLAPPGGAFRRAIGGSWPEVVDAELVIDEPGWHPIRIGWSQGIGFVAFDLRIQRPDADEPAPIAPDRLRFRADLAPPGLAWATFVDAHGLEPHETFLFRQAGFDYAPSNSALGALGLPNDRWTMRWSGQLRVDEPGAYVVRLDTDDGHRLWVDGVRRLDHFTVTTPQNRLTEPLALDVGWHDVVVDLTDGGGGQRIRMTVEDGPELAGGVFPAERWRAVAPRRERTAGARDATGGAIPDGGGEVTWLLPIVAPDGAVALALDVGVTGSHQRWSDVEIAVIPPGGDPIVALAGGGTTVTGNQAIRVAAAVPAGQAVTGAWAVRVRDMINGQTGSVTKVALTVRYAGGEPPIVARAGYESPVEDLGAVVGFDAVTWTGRTPDGASVAVALRSCDIAERCADEPWSPPVTESGERPAVLGRRFAQYRVELTSDGDATPHVDRIEIRYRAP